MTLVDSNVILDITSNDQTWAGWSIQRLEAASLEGPLFINDVVYAEIFIRYERMEDLDTMLEGTGIGIARQFLRRHCFSPGKFF